jgi:transcriptional regulator
MSEQHIKAGKANEAEEILDVIFPAVTRRRSSASRRVTAMHMDDPSSAHQLEFGVKICQPPESSCGNPTGIVKYLCGIATGGTNGRIEARPFAGTLDVMVLQTLAAMGSLHGYGIARRIEQVSGHDILLNQGTIYASLVRLQQRGWIAAQWGTSDNNRKAKFYSITKAGRKQLKQDTAYWQRLAGVMGRVLAMQGKGGEL